MTIQADLVIWNIGHLLTLACGNKPKRSDQTRELGIIENGAIAVRDGQIVAVAREPEIQRDLERIEPFVEIDACGRVVMPGFVDAHNHLIFAGSRAGEFAERLEGVSYDEITARGGGINTTVEATRAASEDELFELGRARLDQMLHYGTTTTEAKSGYALNTDGELKMLRAIRRLQQDHIIDIVPTFLGAHLIPKEYKDRRHEYVDLIINEMIPRVAQEDLAVFNDVFMENCAFDADETKKIFDAGCKHGLMPRLHADELTDMSGAELAAKMNCSSADHLVEISRSGMDALAKSGTAAVMMPGVSFYLGLGKYAPARELIDAGAIVALATDFNPGSTMCENIQMAITFGCMGMKLSPAECISATTVNAAYALGMLEYLGSIEVGKQADIIVLNTKDYVDLGYHYGINHVDTVVKNGKVVVLNRQFVSF